MPRKDRAPKPSIGLPMEGEIARRYAEQRRSGHQLEQRRREARELTADLLPGAEILEVAPGPGYLAIEMARLGSFGVTGLDASRTFVEIATANARASEVKAEFQVGDVADMPFEDGSFDLVVCQAAFKNFARPARAVEQIHRVLRPGGRAVIQDMTRDASGADIAREVESMALRWPSAFMTRLILTWLRRRAYSPAKFEHLVAGSPFRTCQITADGIGMEVQLRKQP